MWGQVTPSKILCVSLLTLAITVPVAAVAGTTAVLRFAGMYLQNVNYVPGEVVALSGTSFEAQYVINQKRGYSPLPPPDAVIATGPLKGTPYWQPIPFLGIPGIQGIQGPPGPALASVVTHAVYTGINSQQTIPGNGNLTIITGWTKDADTANAFNGTTFTAPSAGIYALSVYVSFAQSSWPAGTNFQIIPTQNGSQGEEISYGVIPSAYTGVYALNGFDLLTLNQGDTIEIGVAQNSGSNQTIRNGGAHFSVILVSN